MVHEAFLRRYVLKIMKWSIMVLIPKVGGKFWGTDLLQVLWKFIATSINGKIQQSIILHNSIYGF